MFHFELRWSREASRGRRVYKSSFFWIELAHAARAELKNSESRSWLGKFSSIQKSSEVVEESEIQDFGEMN